MARPELKSYFTSRGACMGQVPGEVVAAAFGCFNPKVVVPAVGAGWQVTSREAILAARERGATEMLRRVLGEQPEGLGRVTSCCAVPPTRLRGRAARSTGDCARSASPATRWVTMWRAADLLREHRGDSHVIAWAVGGADAVEILLLTEQWWGLPARSYTPTRGWTGADMDAGFDRLQRRGLMTAASSSPTPAGRSGRRSKSAPTNSNGRCWTRSVTTWTSSWSTSTPGPRRSSPPAPTRKRITGVYNTGGGPHFGSGLTIDTAAEAYEKA